MGQWPGALEALAVNASFWRGRRVFLTGHTGFKGSWMSLWLHALGAEVTGYALAPATQPSLFKEARIDELMHSIEGDIRDLNHLRSAIEESRCEIVIHLAAQSLVGRSYQDPVETYATNVMGTVYLFEALRRASDVRAVVNVTTDKCYENREWVWGYRESDALGGHDPYSSSKACAELVGQAMRSSYFPPERYSEHGVAIASARAGNVIGGGDWSENRLLPDMVIALERGAIANIRNPDSVRPWQHVLEPLRGYLMLAERLALDGTNFSGPWNFGPRADDARPVRWLADALCQHWGTGAAWSTVANHLPHEAATLRLDTAKAAAQLHWQPRLTLSDALALVVEWSQGRIRGAPVRDLTLQQILHYQEMTNRHGQ